MDLRSNRVEELEQELVKHAQRSVIEKSELIAARDHSQELALKLAISVLALKMRCSKKPQQQANELAIQEEKISMLERCLDEVKADRKALAAKLVQQHDKLAAATEEHTVLSEALILHEKDTDKASCITLENTPLSSIPQEGSSLPASKLALALVKLKAREIHLSKDKSSLKTKILELQKVSKDAQFVLRKTSKEKGELQDRLRTSAIEKETMETDLLALNEKVCELESKLQTSRGVTQDKDNEIEKLRSKMMTNTEILLDLRNENEVMSSDLKLKDVEQKDYRAIIDRLKSENESLMEAEVNLQKEKGDASKQTEEALLELQAAKLFAENRLEEVMQEKRNLFTEVESMHDNMAELEAEKDSLAAKVSDCQKRNIFLSNKVTELEDQANSNSEHNLDIESQLSSAINEPDTLGTTVNSQEAALEDLRDEMVNLSEEKAGVEETLSALHRKMDQVMGERDDLALQLAQAAKGLDKIRMERNGLAAKVANISIVQTPPNISFNVLDVPDSELETSQTEDHLRDSPRKEIIDILNSSIISEDDVDRVCEKMKKAKKIISQIESERKVLKEEVTHLRVGLENAERELATAKDDYTKMSHETFALRDIVSQARTLLEKTEQEKINLSLDLDNAQRALKRIQRNSCESYNAIVVRSQDEIKKLKQEIREKNDSIQLLMSSSIDRANDVTNNDSDLKISRFDISSETIVASNQRNKNDSTPKIKSNDRFKVEKGSMFGMLKDMKKSGRKDRMKYRKPEGR